MVNVFAQIYTHTWQGGTMSPPPLGHIGLNRQRTQQQNTHLFCWIWEHFAHLWRFWGCVWNSHNIALACIHCIEGRRNRCETKATCVLGHNFCCEFNLLRGWLIEVGVFSCPLRVLWTCNFFNSLAYVRMPHREKNTVIEFSRWAKSDRRERRESMGGGAGLA